MKYIERVQEYVKKVKGDSEQFEENTGIDQELLEDAKIYTYNVFLQKVSEDTNTNITNVKQSHLFTSFSDNINENGVDSEYPEGTYSAIIDTETNTLKKHEYNGKPAVFKWAVLPGIISSLNQNEVVVQMDSEELFFPVPNVSGGKRKTKKAKKTKKQRRGKTRRYRK
jgi:hypothetical protein